MITLKDQLEQAIDTFEAMISKDGLISRNAIKKNIGNLSLLAYGIHELKKKVDAGEEAVQGTG